METGNSTILKRQILNAFKLSGFTIRSEHCSYILDQLLPLDSDDRRMRLENITESIQNQGLPTNVVELKHIEKAIKECTRSQPDENETIFSVINAFDIPRYKYDIEKKKYIFDNDKRRLLPIASKKSEYMMDRYTILWQRTSRHDLFSPGVPGTISAGKKFQLRRVENLLATSKMNEVVVIGLLTQLTEGKYYVEDPSGVVPLDLSNAKFHNGLYCDGCFVLAEGTYSDGKLKVSGIGFPPPENAISSRSYFGPLNTWGGESKILLKNSQRLLELERIHKDSSIVFLSDCWLDNPLVMEKLNLLFNGYNNSPPIAIVLMGPFIKADGNPLLLKQKLSAIGDMLVPCDELKKHTDIILVPSLDEIFSSNILPKPALPKSLCSDLLKKYPKIILATNPCRIQYCTQQIVVCRADLITKLCRNTMHFPNTGKLEDHFTKTLICQGTLAPLNSIALPVYWEYDSALLLYPLPDLIVIGDPSQGFQETQHGCTVMNTGSFPKSKFSFKVYVPSSKTIEDSQIPD